MSNLESVIDNVKAIVGESFVLTDEQTLVLYSMDIWCRSDYQAVAVVQPENTEELSKVVAAITSAGFAVAPRGGGMSYTQGYLATEDHTFVIDCLRMNNIVEINRDDMYVTVQTGVTWKQLHEALKGTGLRTPFWGTLSGSKATVGGGLSQNGIFWGGGQFGSAVDSVISVDVVIADGSVVSTGSAAQKNAQPFFRHYGPDLTGLFCADNGALGIKATATIKLLPELKAIRYVSFDFEDHRKLLLAMNEISRQGLAMQCFAFDPMLTEMRAKRDTLVNDAKAFAGVLKNSGSVLGAIKDGARIAMAGRRFMKDLKWPCYVIVEERSQAAADEAEADIIEIGKSFGGKIVEPSIPKIVRANPFGPLNNIIGPGGERWVPVHGLFPLTQGVEVTDKVLDIYEKYDEQIQQHGISAGFLYNNVSTHCIAVEPVFFWPDLADEIQKVSVEPAFYAKVKHLDENLEARAVVNTIREEISELFCEIGAVHLQVGKSYHYADGIKPESLSVMQGIKQVVDPNGRMNPGCLGL